MTSFPETRFQHGILAAPDRILVATDLTDCDPLLPHIVGHAQTCSSHVTLVHAILPANLLPIDASAITAIDQAKIDEVLLKDLDRFAEKIRLRGIPCDAVAEHGFPGDVICRLIEKTGAQRLIMGTHGRGKLEQMLLGSVASEIMRSAQIPILAIGPNAAAPTGHTRPRSLLHPVSLHGRYRETAGFTMDLAQIYRADLTLLHVLDPEDASKRESATEALSALAPDGEKLVPPVYVRIAYGETITEILREAKLAHADWIVVGIEDAVPFWPFQESTAYKVLAAANLPILTYRPPAGRNGSTSNHDAQLLPILA